MRCGCGTFRPRNSAPTPPPPDPPEPVLIGLATTLVDPEGDSDIDKPDGVIDGSVLILAIGHNEAGFIPPDDFLKIGGSAGWLPPPFNWEQEVFIKVVTDASSEPAQYPLTGGGYRDAYLVVLYNVDTAAPVADSSENDGVGLTATGLAVSGTRADSLLLRFEVSSSSNRVSNAPPLIAISVSSPIDGTFNGDYVPGVPVGSTGDYTSDYAGSQEWAVHMILLQPFAA